MNQDKHMSGKSGLAARVNELFRQARRNQALQAPGTLTNVSPRGTIRRAIVRPAPNTPGGASGWL